MPEILTTSDSLGDLYDLKFPITKNFTKIYGSRFVSEIYAKHDLVPLSMFQFFRFYYVHNYLTLCYRETITT